MRAEELLKNISEMLKKHEDFLNSNPELFYAIEDRLYKAIDDEYDPYDEEDEAMYSSGYGDEFFDEVPTEEEGDYGDDVEFQDVDSDDPAAAFLREKEAEQAKPQGFDVKPQAEADEVAEQQLQEAPKKRRGKYRDWAPQEMYEEAAQAKMEELMEQGYSHREAERIAGAMQGGTMDFHTAMNSNINPSEPSPKMLEIMRGLAKDWLANADSIDSKNADPRLNPLKYAAGQSMQAREGIHDNYQTAYDEFANSDEIKNMSKREKYKALRDWKRQYHEQNPDYRESIVGVADKVSQTHAQALEQRKARREEGMRAIAGIGQQEFNPVGEFSSAAAGADADTPMSDQAAAQSVGGVQTDQGYTAATQKDPHSVFAEQFPEYAAKLKQKLNPDQTKRMSAMNALKNKGDN